MAVKITYAGKGYEENDEAGMAVLAVQEPDIYYRLGPVLDDIATSGGTVVLDINEASHKLELQAEGISEELKARISRLLFEKN